MEYEQYGDFNDEDYSGRGLALTEAREVERDDEHVSYRSQQQHDIDSADDESSGDEEPDPGQHTLDEPVDPNVVSEYTMSGALDPDPGPVLSEEENLWVNQHDSDPEYFSHLADWFQDNIETLKADCPPPIADYLYELDARLDTDEDLSKEEWKLLQSYREYAKDTFRQSIEEDTYRGLDDATPENESAGRSRDRAGIDHHDHAYGPQRLRRGVHPEGGLVYEGSDEERFEDAPHYDYSGFN